MAAIGVLMLKLVQVVAGGTKERSSLIVAKDDQTRFVVLITLDEEQEAKLITYMLNDDYIFSADDADDLTLHLGLENN